MTNILFLCIIILLFLACLYFFIENGKLKKKILELEGETKVILERKIMKSSNIDQISIETISKEQKKENKIELPKINMEEKETKTQSLTSESTRNIESFDQKKKTPKTEQSISSQTLQNSNKKEWNSTITSEKKPSTPISSNIKKESINKSNLYQRNTVSNHSHITSPVSISKNDTFLKQPTFDMNKLTLDLNEFIKKSEKVVPKIEEKAKNPDYLKEISEKMANELKPQTIELTDYEKEQEEHAIISYQELLALKDRLTIIDDDEGTINFIEELKKLRNHLK